MAQDLPPPRACCTTPPVSLQANSGTTLAEALAAALIYLKATEQPWVLLIFLDKTLRIKPESSFESVAKQLKN